MQCEHIANSKQSVEGCLLYSCRQVSGILARIREYVHAEILCYGSNVHTDISESYNSYRLTHKLMQRRVPIAKVLIVAPTSVTVL